MIIRRVRLQPFGGIGQSDIALQAGLNVILGPNEAGKSTMVNAAFAALFLSSNTRKSEKTWKDYLSRYLPVGGGDTIRVTVDFTCPEGQDYSLTRSWGATKDCRLESTAGLVITNEDTVAEKLATFLCHGRGTYEGVLFARQDEMLRTVEMLRENKEATNTLGDALRAVLLAAGGVSVDELAATLEAAKKDLLDNWDMGRVGPKNNRGIDNPYKNNVGRLLTSFYKAEQLKRTLRSARLAESNLSEIETKLSCALTEKAEVAPKKAAMDVLADDVQKRAVLEPKLEKRVLEEKNLKAVNVKWPQAITQLEYLQSQMQMSEPKLKALSDELKEAKDAALAHASRERYLVVKPLVEQLGALTAEQDILPSVTGADVKGLDDALARIATREAELAAMKLTGKLTVKRPLTVVLETGLEHKETVTVEQETALTGEGRLVLATADWTVDIRAGQGDVEQILADVRSTREAVAAKLQALNVEDVSRARGVEAARQQLGVRVKQIQAQIDGVLQGQDFTMLEATVLALPAQKLLRDMETVLADQIRMEKDLQQTAKDIQVLQAQLSQWEEEFGDYDAVMDRLATAKSEGRGFRQNLDALAPLPQSFPDTDTFFEELGRLQKKAKLLDEQIYDLKLELMEAQNNLPSLSAEELVVLLDEAEKRFLQLKKEADALHVVEEEFRRVSAEIDNRTFTPFTEAFGRYLSPATGHRYLTAELDGALPTAIRSTDGKELPVDLLSTGTTRGIALALRLAMAEFLLGGARGFMVMDDPLVDLDPERKEHAAKMVQEYAVDRQMIITTCDPETARLLGGHSVLLS
jgi:exonuclease SbcC